MPESGAHIPGMTGVAFVAYCGQLAGLPAADAMQRAHEVLYYVGLGEARYRNLETYSTGMKQRIKLAQAIVHDPDLLFLDEPTNGMDPKGRDEMLELIHDLAHNKNVNLILSSHLLPDVEYTCDHVVVMDKGTIATHGPIEALKGTAGRVYELRVKGDQARFIEVLKAAGYEVHDTDEDNLRVFIPGATDDSTKVLFTLAARERLQVRTFAVLEERERTFARSAVDARSRGLQAPRDRVRLHMRAIAPLLTTEEILAYVGYRTFHVRFAGGLAYRRGIDDEASVGSVLVKGALEDWVVAVGLAHCSTRIIKDDSARHAAEEDPGVFESFDQVH